MSVPPLRARLRAETIAEIRAIARRHLATDGANLSLRAVARDAGLVPSALYRYFPSRDALLTALITDAYTSLAETAQAAEAAVPRDDLPGRFLALAHAVRTWALDNPAEYALIYGSPVPDYTAPPETTQPAAIVVLVLVHILFESIAGGHRPRVPARPLPAETVADLRRLIDQAAPETRPANWTDPADPTPEAALAVGLMLWTQLFGLVSFEVFGRLDDMIEHRRAYFDHQVRTLIDLAGLEPTPTGATP